MNKRIDDMTSEEIFDEVHDLRVQGHFDQAITLMFHLLSRDMRDSDVISYLATLLAEDMQFERAERMFKHLFKLGGDSTVIRYNYAVFLASSGHPLKARDQLRDLGWWLTHKLQALECGDEKATAGLVEETITALDRVTQSLVQVQQELGEEHAAIPWADGELTYDSYQHSPQQMISVPPEELEHDYHTMMEHLSSLQEVLPVMVWQHCENIMNRTGDPMAASDPFIECTKLMDPAQVSSVLDKNVQAQNFYTWIWTSLDDSEDPRAAERISMLNELFELTAADLDAPVVPKDRQRQTSLQFGSADLPLFQRGK